MTGNIKRELRFPQPIDQVWSALTDSKALAEWMYPNDFEAKVGHRFTFRVPPNPEAGFEGIVVRCEVLACTPRQELAFSWSAGGVVENTRVSYRLERDGDGTLVTFEHTGFDVSEPGGKQALGGAKYGWKMMHDQLVDLLARTR